MMEAWCNEKCVAFHDKMTLLDITLAGDCIAGCLEKPCQNEMTQLDIISFLDVILARSACPLFCQAPYHVAPCRWIMGFCFSLDLSSSVAISPVELSVLVAHVQTKVAVHLSQALLSGQSKHEHAGHLGRRVPQVLRLEGVRG